MNPWELFCHLCKTVVEEQDVYLDILVTPVGVEMLLMPMGEEEEDD